MKDDLNIFEMEDNLNFWKMEDDLNFWKMKDDLNCFKTTSKKITQPKTIQSKNNNIFENGR